VMSSRLAMALCAEVALPLTAAGGGAGALGERERWAPRAALARRRSAGAGLVVLFGLFLLAALAGGNSSILPGAGFLSPPAPPGGALRGGGAATAAAAAAAVGSSAGVSGAAAAAGPSGAAGLTGAVLALSSLAAALLAGGRAAARRRAPRATWCRAAGDGKTPLEDLKVGDKVEGTVKRVSKVGVWVDIGSVKDALLPTAQVPKGPPYKAGDTISDMTISEVTLGATPSERKIRVSMGGEMPTGGPSTGFKEGDILDGTVARTSNFGIFFDVGGSRDVLAPNRLLDKAPTEYKAGDKMKLKVMSVDGEGKTTVTTNIEAAPAAPVKSVKVGDEVDGTVSQVSDKFGLFINIGTGSDALFRISQLEKPVAEYSTGEKVPGLKVSSVNEKGQVEVSTRKLASEVKEGDKLEGIVGSISKFGVFFDAGLSTDVLAPGQYLSKPVDQYSKGEVADLIVMKVDGNRISVSTKGEEEMGTPLTKLVRGAEVTGKILRIEPMGIFLDVGAAKDALLRTKSLPKPASEYKVGDEFPGLLVTKVDIARGLLEVSVAGFIPTAEERGTSLGDLTVGTPVDGIVTRAMEFGVFVNIGAERDALWPSNQLPKLSSEYKVGEKIEGLKISQCDVSNNRLSVSTKNSAADYEVGAEVTGTVTKIMPFGLFVDIGASTEALLPSRLMAKESTEYSIGAVLPELKISQLDVAANKISVGEVEGGKSLMGDGGGAGRLSIDDLEIGQKVKGVVRQSKDYGVFVDIGMGRRDALMPGSYLGEGVEVTNFEANQEIEAYVAQIDANTERVTLSYMEPPEGGFGDKKKTIKYDGAVPFGQRIPDVTYWAKRCRSEDMIDDEPVPWKEWETKYPGLVKHADKEVELPLCNQGYGFSGLDAARKSSVHWLPVPMHLRNIDAGAPTIPDFDFDDYEMGFDYGIKPEIHVKYREPPFNDPNWTNWSWRPPLKYKRVKGEYVRVEDEPAEEA